MSWERSEASWERIRNVLPVPLREARLQLHWAAQAVAGLGRALCEARRDDSHTSMSWHADERSFLGARTPSGLRAALRPARPTLLLVNENDTVVARLPLENRTLSEAYAWLAEQYAQATGRRVEPRFERPPYDLPMHKVGRDEPFTLGDVGAYSELASWYANGARLAETVREESQGASPVRCWPHHFDIGTLIDLDPAERDSGRKRTIGVGMSPGDETHDEPYFYVSPWPRPEASSLPPLQGDGVWQTAGFVAAVLPASRIARGSTPAEQARQVHTFLRSALVAARRLLGTPR